MGACLFFFLGMSLFIQYDVHCFENKIGSLYKKNSTISFIVLFKNHVNSILRAFANRWANCLQSLTIFTKFEPSPYHNVIMYWEESVQRHLSGIYINKKNPFKFKWHNKFIFFLHSKFWFHKAANRHLKHGWNKMCSYIWLSINHWKCSLE